MKFLIQNDPQCKHREKVYSQKRIEDSIITVSMMEIFVKVFNSF